MNNVKSEIITGLRKRAEDILQTQTNDVQELSDKDVQSLIQELQVHQIELEMQNEELRKAQNELEEARNRYVDLYDFAPVGYFTFDKDGLILDVNLTGAQMLGAVRSNLIKQPFLLYIFPGSRDAFLHHLRQVFKDRSRQICEIKLKDKKGTQFDARLESLLVQDNKAKSDQCRTVVSDITEKKRMEKQLLRAQRMESIGILAGGIAHNLNNMLTPMMMSLRMLKEKFKDEESQKLLTILERNSERSAELIKQVLSFSRGIEGERKPLAAKHIIAEIEAVAKEIFPKNIEIRTDIPKDLFTISGDATQLHQVIMNLCVNARDAMPYGGILRISAENFFVDADYARMNTEAKAGSYVVIKVSDTGVGIPPEILNQIFEPFFTTKGFGKGTGLGLSTALAIVKSHGGFIDVESEVGKGTIFRVYLPAIKAEMQEAEEQHPKLLSGNGECILVAEDEASVREVTTSTLEAHGYEVLTADDGAQAVALYAQNIDKIDIVLMDLMMPVMDGEASIRAIRRINPEVKIITVSGLTDEDKLTKVTDMHMQDFLPKPYTAERLLKVVHEILSK